MWGFGLRAWGLGFKLQAMRLKAWDLGLKVQGLGFKAWAFGFRVGGWGLGFAAEFCGLGFSRRA